MKLSRIVGVLSDEVKVYKEQEGEKFLQRNICIGRKTVPIVYSEFLGMPAEGKVNISGYLRTELNGETFFHFFFVIDASQAAEDSPIGSHMHIEGVIQRVDQKQFSKRGAEILPVVIRYVTWDDNTNVIHATIANAHARRFGSLNIVPRETEIEAIGHIKTRRRYIEVALDEIIKVGGEDFVR